MDEDASISQLPRSKHPHRLSPLSLYIFLSLFLQNHRRPPGLASFFSSPLQFRRRATPHISELPRSEHLHLLFPSTLSKSSTAQPELNSFHTLCIADRERRPPLGAPPPRAPAAGPARGHPPADHPARNPARPGGPRAPPLLQQRERGGGQGRRRARAPRGESRAPERGTHAQGGAPGVLPGARPVEGVQVRERTGPGSGVRVCLRSRLSGREFVGLGRADARTRTIGNMCG
jgi:hypothetical protein